MQFYPFEDLDTISPRPILLIAGQVANSRYFSEDAFRGAAEPKELYIVPGASHVDLYDRVRLIPWDKLTSFFNDPSFCVAMPARTNEVRHTPEVTAAEVIVTSRGFGRQKPSGITPSKHVTVFGRLRPEVSAACGASGDPWASPSDADHRGTAPGESECRPL